MPPKEANIVEGQETSLHCQVFKVLKSNFVLKYYLSNLGGVCTFVQVGMGGRGQGGHRGGGAVHLPCGGA